MATHTAMAQGSNASMRNSFEQRIGIQQFASTHEHSWHGTLRTRYTDFQVHEITKTGEVVHLHDFYISTRDLAKSMAPQHTVAKTNDTQSSGLALPAAPVRDIDTVATSIKEESGPNTGESKGDQGPSTTITPSDQSILEELVGQTTAEALVSFYTRIIQNPKTSPKSHGEVKTQSIPDKAKRAQVHSEIRRIFSGKIDTTTGNDDSIMATGAGGRNQRGNNRSRSDQPRNNRQGFAQSNGGPFLHFSLYKENRDTMDALNHISRCLKVQPSVFGTAGTKDRRAVTVQRVSIKNRNPQSLIFLNNKIPSIKVGDFKYDQQPIHLGSHSGNEFVVVLKNCVFSGTEDLTFKQTLGVARSTVDSALSQIVQNGFINYYGTQRFGTHQIGTQEVGMKILKDDFEGAVRSLLSFDPSLLHVSDKSHIATTRREDIGRAQACSTFLEKGDYQAALRNLPPRCNVERTIIGHLGKQPRDFTGAIQSIHRSMRTMYVHAYQSLVWNFVASKRWDRFGTRVVKGDLVLVKPDVSNTQTNGESAKDVKDSIHLLEADDVTEDTSGLKVHALTDDEANSGKYTVFDIVLPSPGWGVMYPPNEIGQFYSEFMAKEENGCLDPQNMRRRQRDFSLPGAYRKLMGKIIGTPTASIQAYSDDLEQLVPTDLDVIQSRKTKEMSKHDANQQKPQAEWHNFSRNIREKELEESRSRIEKRKAEELSPSAPIQVSDTWVETSLDGNSKRVKIARHTEDVSGVKPDAQSDIPQCSEDTVQGGDRSAHKSDVSTGNIIVDQPDTAEEVQSVDQDDNKSSSSIVTAFTQQLPTGIQTAQTPDIHVSTVTGQESSVSDGAEQMSQSIPISQTAEATGNIGPEPTTETAPQPSDVATREKSPPRLQESSVTNPTDAKKIAVILRFALKTSQYATIVIRELQGDALVGDPKSSGAAPLVSSPSPSEGAANSS
ncbi:pseudouridine synthase [Biscogniauxia marginata]|nr:pseudouridine synthase [Biscogniauxia marginata]